MMASSAIPARPMSVRTKGDWRRRNATVRAITVTSVRVPVGQAVPQGHPQDLDVERKRPVLDVVEVVLDAFGEAGVAAPAVDLGPARDSRAHAVAQHVLGELVLELAHELRQLRARADERHLSPEDIDELGQLVE